jgi:plasmid stabilization system protein ParE
VAEVTLHSEAETEYENVLAWYLDRSPQAAERFEAAFDEAIEAIRRNPAMFPLCDDTHRFVLPRRYPYSLVYRFNGDAAVLLPWLTPSVGAIIGQVGPDAVPRRDSRFQIGDRRIPSFVAHAIWCLPSAIGMLPRRDS